MKLRSPFQAPSVLFILIAMSVCIFSGCWSRKKPVPRDIQEWLNVHWKDRFEVLATPTNFTDKEYYYGKRKSVIADKSDLEVQFILTWTKEAADVGLTRDIVEEALLQSQTEVTQAREIVEQLKDRGLQNISAGVTHGYAHVFLFAEPLPEERDKAVRGILDVLQSIPENNRLPCELHFMEAAKYGTEFQEIIPAGHWARRDHWQQTNEIMRLTVPVGETDLTLLSKRWRFNTYSDRMTGYIAQAHPKAQQWAIRNISEQVYVEGEQMIEYWVDEENGLLLRIGFPYRENTSDPGHTRTGTVSGEYDIDRQSFGRLHNIPATDQ